MDCEGFFVRVGCLVTQLLENRQADVGHRGAGGLGALQEV